MTDNSFDEQCIRIICELGLADKKDIGAISSLAGGVSSDIVVVSIGDKKVCVKRSLEKLRVSEVWEAPLRRNETEYEWLTFVSNFLPEAVPALFGKSASGNGFVMSYFDPATHKNWKSELMAGKVDTGFASAVGDALGKIHRHSTVVDIDFPYQEDFKQLRLEPYFLFTATKHPALATYLHTISDELFTSRIALVHGDVSPKNILISATGPVFLDAECAVLGDPSFDLSFCINHLLIKMIIGVADWKSLQESISKLWQSYQTHVSWEAPTALEARICKLIPLMMLARVDGKSPVEYHTPTSENTIRNLATNLISEPQISISALLSRINKENPNHHENR